MPHLFDELKVRGVTLRNRIGVSPMCQYSSENGMASDWHLVHLGSRAIGGAGLVIMEATAVEPAGRITPGCMGIWSDEHAERMAPITRFLRQHGAVAGLQIAHAGRKGSAAKPWEGDGSLAAGDGSWETIAPSPIAFGGKITHAPREATVEDMSGVRKSFVKAAQRAVAAGFNWLELHAAHGYLLHSFHSPLTNRRTDEYGGSFENRIRFTLETVRAIRLVWPDDLPFSVRLSCTDWVDGGWTLEESISLSRLLKAEGVDVIDCSSGANVPDARIPAGASFQVPFSEAIRKQAGVATAAVGLITEPMQADEIIRNGRADIVLLAREMLRNPHWPIEAAAALRKTDRLKLPIQYSHWVG